MKKPTKVLYFAEPEGIPAEKLKTYTHFQCGICDERRTWRQFSHVANLIGLLCCKACNKGLPLRPTSRRKAA